MSQSTTWFIGLREVNSAFPSHFFLTNSGSKAILSSILKAYLLISECSHSLPSLQTALSFKFSRMAEQNIFDLLRPDAPNRGSSPPPSALDDMVRNALDRNRRILSRSLSSLDKEPEIMEIGHSTTDSTLVEEGMRPPVAMSSSIAKQGDSRASSTPKLCPTDKLRSNTDSVQTEEGQVQRSKAQRKRWRQKLRKQAAAASGVAPESVVTPEQGVAAGNGRTRSQKRPQANLSTSDPIQGERPLPKKQKPPQNPTSGIAESTPCDADLVMVIRKDPITELLSQEQMSAIVDWVNSVFIADQRAVSGLVWTFRSMNPYE